MGTGRGSTDVANDEPSAFHFVTVDGTRLRYLDRGHGTPVLLLHGNGSTIEDFVSSGIMDDAETGYRFIAFDRPGFGLSERPRGRAWTPSEQARLLLRALVHLEIERPIVIGHSWGALVALAMALESAEAVAGLVLLSGYYYPTRRAVTMGAPAAFGFGNILRHVVAPAVRRLMAGATVSNVFAPCMVPERFKRTFPMSLAMQPSHMRAVDEEAAMLFDAASALCTAYSKLVVPLRIIAGSDDRIVDTDLHSARLHEDVGTSTFQRVPGCGHMVHHAAPADVLAAVASVGLARAREQANAALTTSPPRKWLHIGERPAAA